MKVDETLLPGYNNKLLAEGLSLFQDRRASEKFLTLVSFCLL